MKSTQGSLMDPDDLAAMMAEQEKPEVKVDQPVTKPKDVLHDFKISDKPAPDTFKPRKKRKKPRRLKIAAMLPLLTVQFSEAIYLAAGMREAADRDWISFLNSREERMLSGAILNSL